MLPPSTVDGSRRKGTKSELLMLTIYLGLHLTHFPSAGGPDVPLPRKGASPELDSYLRGTQMMGCLRMMAERLEASVKRVKKAIREETASAYS